MAWRCMSHSLKATDIIDMPYVMNAMATNSTTVFAPRIVGSHSIATPMAIITAA